MKPRKFVAATARGALAKVREALGDDAVILSNRATHGGVEVVAIAEIDFETLVGTVESDTSAIAQKRPSVAEQVAMQVRGSASPMQEEGGDRQLDARTGGVYAGHATGAFPWESDAQKKQFSFVDFVKGRRPEKVDQRGGQSADSTRQSSGGLRSAPNPNPNVSAGARPNDDNVAASSLNRLLHAPSSLERPRASSRMTPASAPESGRSPLKRDRAPNLVDDVNAGETRPLIGERAILDEIKSLRSLMEGRGETPRSPAPSNGTHIVPAMLRRELLAAGWHTTVTDAALDGLPINLPVVQARDWIEARLSRSLACAAADEDIIETGGVFALTGPTGVGKTTTAAKLAARCAVRYGAKSVGLITTDTYRIGAPDQLRIYGKILGVPVHTVHDFDWLHRTLDMLRDRRLILIDTIGMGQRDGRVKENLDFLDECRVKRLLLLAAPSQPETQEEVVEFYRGRTAVGTILTKVDEAVKLAPTISVLLRFKQRLRYVANGQRVPEDLHIPDPSKLIRIALRVDATRAERATPATEVRNSAKRAH